MVTTVGTYRPVRSQCLTSPFGVGTLTVELDGTVPESLMHFLAMPGSYIDQINYMNDGNVAFHGLLERLEGAVALEDVHEGVLPVRQLGGLHLNLQIIFQ